VREIERLRAKEHHWQNLELKPGQDPLNGVAGELIEIQAEIEPGQAEQVGFKIRDIDVIYKPKSRHIHCLGESGPLRPIGGRIRLHVLVDRTSIELFGNQGVLSMSSCMLPADDNKSLAVFCEGGQAKIISLTVWELKSAWNK